MKKLIPVLLIFLFLAASSLAAQDCSLRGSVTIKLDKSNFLPGEDITGNLILENSDIKDTYTTYNLFLFSEGVQYRKFTETRTVPPGKSSYPIRAIFLASVPDDAPTGKWMVQLVTGMDQCYYDTREFFTVTSCKDGLLNGDEEGIDCGGFCKKLCPIVATTIPQVTTSVPASQENQFLTQYLPAQLPKNFFLYLTIFVLLIMVIVGSSILYWRRRARFSKFY